MTINNPSIFNNEEIFRLKVGEIVYAILKDRDMTFTEVKKLQEAIKSSLDLILSQHQTECRAGIQNNLDAILNDISDEIRDQSTMLSDAAIDKFIKEKLPLILDKVITERLKTERLEYIEKKDKRLYRNLGIMIAILGLFFTLIQILIIIFRN